MNAVAVVVFVVAVVKVVLSAAVKVIVVVEGPLLPCHR